MPALQRAFDHFWNNDPGPGGVGLQDRYAAAWRHVAAYFRHTPWVLGYDLLNEPWPGTTWAQCVNPVGCPVFDALLTQFNQRSIAAIRQADPTTLVWYEPNVLFNNGADTRLGNVGDSHAGFAFHDYCLAASGDTYRPREPGLRHLRQPGVRQRREAVSDATGDALVLTEFGATNDASILTKMTNRADANMVSWQEWAYCGCGDPTTSGPGATQAIVLDPAKAPTGSNIKAAKLALLSRAYPQLVAGTPESFSFDGE